MSLPVHIQIWARSVSCPSKASGAKKDIRAHLAQAVPSHSTSIFDEYREHLVEPFVYYTIRVQGRQLTPSFGQLEF